MEKLSIYPAPSLIRPTFDLYFITLLTIAYLVVELSFNARLLDVIGGDTPPNIVKSIEYWGRSLSGVAVTLAVWGIWLLPAARRYRWPIVLTLTLMLLSGALAGIGMWRLQSAIIDNVVDQATGDDRRIAAKLKLVERDAIEHKLAIAGIDLTPAVMASPEGKSFLSLLPFMASSGNKIEERLDRGMQSLVRDEVVKKFGDPQTIFTTVFQPSIDQIRQAYNQYAQASNSYQDALDSTGGRERSAWQTYEAGLAAKGVTPATLPTQYWGQAREAVQRKGVPVSNGWNPSDRQAFDAAIAGKVRAEADSRYNAEMQRQLGEILPRKLGLDDFEALPLVQARWHEALHLDGDTKLSHELNGDAFMTAVYEPLLTKATAQILAKTADPSTDYQDSGNKGVLGRDAMSALIVPPIALAFSISGALLHIYKSANYMTQVMVSWLALAKGRKIPVLAWLPFLKPPSTLIAVLVVATALSAFQLPNKVTTSPLYAYFEEHLMQRGAVAQAMTCRWIIQAQHFFWPINEWIRVNMLNRFDF